MSNIQTAAGRMLHDRCHLGLLAGESGRLSVVSFFFSSRGRHTRCSRDWSSDVCSSDLDEIVLLPLYPHYSFATTLSSLKEWRRVYGEPDGGPPERTIDHFYDHPLYVQALVERIGSVLRQFEDGASIHLVFSAHGLPMSLVEKGDPYPKQIEGTVRAVCESGAKQYDSWPRTHLLCYQSRVGPAKWLSPALTETIEIGRAHV